MNTNLSKVAIVVARHLKRAGIWRNLGISFASVWVTLFWMGQSYQRTQDSTGQLSVLEGNWTTWLFIGGYPYFEILWGSVRFVWWYQKHGAAHIIYGEAGKQNICSALVKCYYDIDSMLHPFWNRIITYYRLSLPPFPWSMILCDVQFVWPRCAERYKEQRARQSLSILNKGRSRSQWMRGECWKLLRCLAQRKNTIQ